MKPVTDHDAPVNSSTVDPGTSEDHPRHLRPGLGGFAKAILGLIAIVVVLGLLITSYVVGRGARVASDIVDEVTGEGPFLEIAPVTVQSIRNLSELTTVEYVEYTRVQKGEDRGWLNWVDGDRIELFAVARIGAGVDLAQLEEADIDADPETGRASISLPAADITYVAVDNEATHVYNRETGILTDGDPDLERTARLAAEEVLVASAEEAGILDDAATRAQTVIEDLLTSLGYTDVNVQIERG